MADLVGKLASNGGDAGALNDIVAQLWPNINVAGSKMIQDIVNPMFKTMLPGPLSDMHFTKVDLGDVPMVFSNVKVTKTAVDGIMLGLNLDWNGDCDMQLDGKLIPKLGVKSVRLHGLLTVLLCPITNILPLIGAAQLAFVNPPTLELDFTGAAEVADLGIIDVAVRKTILSVVNSMFTLPNRFLYKLDATADYFKTYHEPLGVVRITVEKAWGFAKEANSAAKKFFSKITQASPDCFVEVSVGAEDPWKTTVKDNTTSPVWNETHDFIVTDLEQRITLDIEDHDINSNDKVGEAVTTVREVLGGKKEFDIVLKGQETGGKVSISTQYFAFGGDVSASSEGLSGLLTVLIAGATGIQGKREELHPSVVVKWGEKKFQTAIQNDYAGYDINNPTIDTQFRFPITSDLLKGGNIRLVVLNKTEEIGSVEIELDKVKQAEKMVLADSFDVGNGAKVRACFYLRGLTAATGQETTLAQR